MRSSDPSPAADHGSSLPASDTDRNSVIELLRHHTSEGRLTIEEFDQRVGEVYGAKTIGQLQQATRDLPVVPFSAGPPGTASARPPEHRRRGMDPALAGFICTSLLLIFIWAMTGAGYFWPAWAIVPLGLGAFKRTVSGDHPRHRHGDR